MLHYILIGVFGSCLSHFFVPKVSYSYSCSLNLLGTSNQCDHIFYRYDRDRQRRYRKPSDEEELERLKKKEKEGSSSEEALLDIDINEEEEDEEKIIEERRRKREELMKVFILYSLQNSYFNIMMSKWHSRNSLFQLQT